MFADFDSGQKIEVFFDSLDHIRTSIDSAPSEDGNYLGVEPDPAFSQFDYDVWRDVSISVRDRREKFFCRMGLGEFMLSSVGRQHGSHDEDGNLLCFDSRTGNTAIAQKVEMHGSGAVVSSVEPGNLLENGAVTKGNGEFSVSKPLGSSDRVLECLLEVRRRLIGMSLKTVQEEGEFRALSCAASLNSSDSDQILNSSSIPSTSSRDTSPCENGMGKDSLDGRIRVLVGVRWRKDVSSNVNAKTESNKKRTHNVVGMSRGIGWKTVIFNGEDNLIKDLEIGSRRKTGMDWWIRFMKRRGHGTHRDDVPIVQEGGYDVLPNAMRMRVRKHKKRFLELSGVYMEQEIQAHKGSIWTMKFSPDGKFLASGGEDRVVRIWQIVETASRSCKCVEDELVNNFEISDTAKDLKCVPLEKNSTGLASFVIPEKLCRIEETPLHEFCGHTTNILDLSWSKSNCLLSSSEDKTVRLWQVGRKECLKVFHHNDYVTCVQFNPVDDRYFISGSIDGKLRIWGVLENRVLDWANVHDIITAVCYKPDGQGCIVGTIDGKCLLYDSSDAHLRLDAQLCILSKKKPSGTRITGFQFSPGDSHRVMITSADSKIRILDSLNAIQKYKGFRKSGNQISASFTPNGKHIISVDEDSRVYVWNYNCFGVASSKGWKSIRSCEHFCSEGVLVAIPWNGMVRDKKCLFEGHLFCSSQQLQRVESTFSWTRDSDCFSLGSWFFNDSSLLRTSATWPEEKLPLWTVPFSTDNDHRLNQHGYRHEHCESLPATCGMVIVTAGLDGVIRSFHNYGLPGKI